MPSKKKPNTCALGFKLEFAPKPELPSSVTGIATCAHGKSSFGINVVSGVCIPCILTLTRSSFNGSFISG